MPSIYERISTLHPEAHPLVNVVADGNIITSWRLPFPQPTQAQLDAVTQAQVDAAKLTKLRSAATSIHDNNNAEAIALRSTIKLLVDELNTLRQWMAAMKTEVAASSSLADFKTRVATLPATPARTYVQARTAVRNLIDKES